MTEREEPLRGALPPPRAARVLAVVRRHWVVYASTFVANAMPAFFEPVLFLLAIGIGLGAYVQGGMDGLPVGAYMGPGALAMTAMFTAAYETTYGTFVRLVYQKTYDGMLATPLTPDDVFLGEVLWCGCKGVLFSSCVLLVYLGFALATGWWRHLNPWTLPLLPLVGGCCSLLFGGLGLHMAAVTRNMNNFAFFFSGCLSPMSLFSGMVFPVADLPAGLRELAYALPLFHVTELNRLLMFGPARCVSFVWLCPLYLLVVTALLVWSGVRLMRRRIIQ
ncbi:MAG: ABC transporter permease [Planctomycetota bacterium]